MTLWYADIHILKETIRRADIHILKETNEEIYRNKKWSKVIIIIIETLKMAYLVLVNKTLVFVVDTDDNPVSEWTKLKKKS